MKSDTVSRHLVRLSLLAVCVLSMSHPQTPPGALAAQPPANGENAPARLVGLARLDARTFAIGPTSGEFVAGHATEINGEPVPFRFRQPVQGFSAILANGDGTFAVLSDNGFGRLENSADYHLRIYTIRPDFRTADGAGSGRISVEHFIELRDPDGHVPFAIVNQFTPERILTGADFDPESFQRAADGSFWIGEEFGPFLLHADATGKLLSPPIALPDFDRAENEIRAEIRAPQNPYTEPGSTVRIMHSVRAHARKFGNGTTPVCSPSHLMLIDDAPASGQQAVPGKIFDVAAMKAAGFPVVVWTVNDAARMRQLIGLGVSGIITDRPDVLLKLLRETADTGDWFTAEGLLNCELFDAQGHRGARDLRPENTLPAMEAALDFLVTTLETDVGLTADGVPVLCHDPALDPQKFRRADGTAYTLANEIRLKDISLARLQRDFVADKVFRGPAQSNDPALSPVAVAFAAATNLPHIYAAPSLEQLFAFVDFYAEFYTSGAGNEHPEAALRAANAARVRFNIETKSNPTPEAAGRAADGETLALKVASAITANAKQHRAQIQSFDLCAVFTVQSNFSQIRTACLFGDTLHVRRPENVADAGKFAHGRPNPWLAGLFWPYRSAEVQPLRARPSGGFEGMAISPDGSRLWPMLEKPLADSARRELLIHEFDLAVKRYTGVRHRFPLAGRATAIGDFMLLDARTGLVIERDDSQGDLAGFKRLVGFEFGGPGEVVRKFEVADLLKIAAPAGMNLPASPGDVGMAAEFAFPFWTIEGLVRLGESRMGVLNDNNYPFSVGRHMGTGKPDDCEFIVLEIPQLTAPR